MGRKMLKYFTKLAQLWNPSGFSPLFIDKLVRALCICMGKNERTRQRCEKRIPIHSKLPFLYIFIPFQMKFSHSWPFYLRPPSYMTIASHKRTVAACCLQINDFLLLLFISMMILTNIETSDLMQRRRRKKKWAQTFTSLDIPYIGPACQFFYMPALVTFKVQSIMTHFCCYFRRKRHTPFQLEFT